MKKCHNCKDILSESFLDFDGIKFCSVECLDSFISRIQSYLKDRLTDIEIAMSTYSNGSA